ncbi:MAG: 1-acyl-sn-glycerol-3-phosphate acyltransferase [Symbiobacteriaceae bacterium]|nr:1-acyl-sn-glycerol-3-phosphate acyltransferase [Symbiobacteriaceae bacterium]
MWLYRLCHKTIRGLLSLFWRIDISGLEHVPDTGGGIICSNHKSTWDPVVLAISVDRTLHFMAKEELYRTAFMRWLLPQLGAVRVKRGLTDRRAIREYLAYLNAGDLCGIFPEGTRSRDGELHDFYQGAAYFALKSGQPLIPAALVGEVGRVRSHVQVRFGTAVQPPHQDNPERETMEILTRRLMESVQALQGYENGN